MRAKTPDRNGTLEYKHFLQIISKDITNKQQSQESRGLYFFFWKIKVGSDL